MKLKRLKIDKFKCMSKIEMTFSQENILMIIGKNGSGKSYLLESIIEIFNEILNKETPIFSYELDYELDRKQIKITGTKNKNILMVVDNKKVSKGEFFNYLPNHIFCYYSGNNNRFSPYFEKNKKKYYDEIIKTKDTHVDFRKLFLAENIHSQFILMTFFVYYKTLTSEEKKFLLTELKIKNINSINLILKEPQWRKKRIGSQENLFQFWGADGLVKDFLTKASESAFYPLYTKESIKENFNKKKTLEKIYLNFEKDKVGNLSLLYNSSFKFFQMLESTYISDMIDKIEINIENIEGEIIEFSHMSEGEQQLLTVLGLVKFIQKKGSLFLLDEPDTHLNPIWKYKYFSLLKSFLGEKSETQIIMNSHDPIVISNLKKENIRVLKENGEVKIPKEDPKYLGVSGVLRDNDLFGLESLVSLELTTKLYEKRRLSLKEVLSEKEMMKLKKLNKEIEKIDFSNDVRDPLYSNFVKAKTALLNDAIQMKDFDLLKKLLNKG